MARTEAEFQQLQRRFTAAVRDPAATAVAGVEPRRLRVYQELVYNTVEGFLRSGFPVLHAISDDTGWQRLVRDFVRRGRCRTPYFLEIGQEFLRYLQTERAPEPADPPFLLELAHYEWVELALDTDATDLAAIAADADADLLAGIPLLSPLAWALAYRFPVHRIGPVFQPQQPSAEPHYLLVYRNRADSVRFMEINAATARLLELLRQPAATTGRELLAQLARELAQPDPAPIMVFGAQLLLRLAAEDVILGALPA
jgi:hypothetical protein